MQQSEIFQHPELDGTSFYWPKGPTAVLCLHGFTATTVDVRGIAGIFSKNDFTTSAPLLPGHGTTPEDLNATSWRDWFNTAEQAYLELRKNHQHIFILGESLGGLLALHLAVKYQDISGLMLLAPALIIPKLWISKLVFPFKEYIFKPYVLKKNSEDKMPWQGYNVVPLKAGASFFDFQQMVKRELNQVTVPAIIFQGKKDATIDPASSFIVHDKISSSSKELVWLPNSGHVILLDQQYLDAERLCLEFIQQNLDRIFHV
jgi:carboxylesterase